MTSKLTDHDLVLIDLTHAIRRAGYLLNEQVSNESISVKDGGGRDWLITVVCDDDEAEAKRTGKVK